MASDFALSAKRPQLIAYFKANVSSGLNTVSFHNANASMVGNSSPESSLSSASSFSMAASCSGSKAGFCSGLLNSLASQLDNLTKDAVMATQSANMKMAAQQGTILKDKSGKVLKDIVDKKDKAMSALSKFKEETEEQMKTLEGINSNADVKFKGLKESAEQKEFIAKNHYYLQNSRRSNDYGTYSSNFNASNNNASKNASGSNSTEETKASSSGLNFMGMA